MFDALTEGPDQARKVLRVHQSAAIDLLRDAFRRGNRRVVIQGPTGFGKTLVAAKIIEGALEKGNRVLFTAPAVNLVDQTIAAFEDEGITDIGAMQAQHARTNSLARVQVACDKTLARREAPKFDLAIVDECHIGSAAVNKLIEENPSKFFVGLSATPWAKGMGLRWQELTIPITISELISQGYLSEFTAYAPHVPDLSGVKVSKGDYAESGLEEVMGDAQILGNVVDTWLAKGEGRPTLVFAVNRNHAAQLAAAFERRGVATAYVDGNTDSVERHSINRRFRSGEVRVICSVRTMTTGVDLPVSCIIDAAPTKSEMLHVQKIGRGLRVNAGTEDCLILDHAGNSIRLGLVTDIGRTTLDRSKPGEKPEAKPRSEKLPKPCAKCETLHTGKTCPKCGNERTPPPIEEAKGELVQISGKKKKHNKPEKQAFWSMALWVARKRGYQKGWASHLYRGKFGVWPKNLDDTETPPDLEFNNYEKSRRIARAKSKQKAAQ